jgi:glyoxylase-like metal-dependent hydrolase (beta-lactamase superfamily II)
MKIIEGIYLIPEMGMSNAYLVEDGDKLLVIDTGTPSHAQKIISYVKSLGKDPRSIETIVLTHPDLDHSGSTAPTETADWSQSRYTPGGCTKTLWREAMEGSKGCSRFGDESTRTILQTSACPS